MTDRRAAKASAPAWEAPGDFHFDLHHADVLLGLIIGEGHGEVGGEAQNIVFKVTQTDEKIMPRTTRLSASCAGSFYERRLLFVERQPQRHNPIVKGHQSAQDAIS